MDLLMRAVVAVVVIPAVMGCDRGTSGPLSAPLATPDMPLRDSGDVGVRRLGRESPAPVQPKGDPARESPDLRAIADLTGSLWALTYRDPVLEEERRFRIWLRPNGRLVTGDDRDATPNNDTWAQRGDRVTFSFNDGYAIYRGRLSADGQRLTGEASNEFERWSWTGDRRPSSPAGR